jgi:hypothetical protein
LKPYFFRANTRDHLIILSAQDFDVPGKIAGLPFLNEQAKRIILGETARKLFACNRN